MEWNQGKGTNVEKWEAKGWDETRREWEKREVNESTGHERTAW